MAKEEIKVTHTMNLTLDVPARIKGDPLNTICSLSIKKNDFIIVSGDDAEFIVHQLTRQGEVSGMGRQLGFNIPIIIMDNGRIELKTIKSVKALLKRMEKAKKEAA